MKRCTQLFPLLIILLCHSGDSTALCKLHKNTGKSASGAVVVLEDLSWKSREVVPKGSRGYVWATSGIVLYKQIVAGECRVVRRRVTVDGKASSPEFLPPLLSHDQEIASLSPDGKTLCLSERREGSGYLYTFVHTEGKGKPIVVKSKASRHYWSPDSRYVYGTPDNLFKPTLERIEPQTGEVTTTPLALPGWSESILNGSLPRPQLDCITPDGKLLCLSDTLRSRPTFSGPLNPFTSKHWQLSQLRGANVITTTHQKHFGFAYASLSLSPDGRRILWGVTEGRVREIHLPSSQKPSSRIQWLITDIEGNNANWMGASHLEEQQDNEQMLHWTPDGKGVHFVEEDKLIYLAVP